MGPRLGPGPQDAKEARALNRVITWQAARIEYEADPRQSDRLIDECGLHGAEPMGKPPCSSERRASSNERVTKRRSAAANNT